MKTLGNKIAELRKLRQMTQEELATQFNVSSQAVSKWENDLSIPDVPLLIQIADFFEVSLDDLLRQQENKKVVQLVPEEIRKPMDKLMLKIVVTDKKDNIRINLPMQLVKICLEIGLALPSVSHNEQLKGIDLHKIIDLVEVGCIGKLMEIDSENGDHVEIVVE